MLIIHLGFLKSPSLHLSTASFGSSSTSMNVDLLAQIYMYIFIMGTPWILHALTPDVALLHVWQYLCVQCLRGFRNTFSEMREIHLVSKSITSPICSDKVFESASYEWNHWQSNGAPTAVSRHFFMVGHSYCVRGSVAVMTKQCPQCSARHCAKLSGATHGLQGQSHAPVNLPGHAVG